MFNTLQGWLTGVRLEMIGRNFGAANGDRKMAGHGGR
jgi:hypothetical protein